MWLIAVELTLVSTLRYRWPGEDEPLKFVAQLNYHDLWNNSLLFRASGLPSKYIVGDYGHWLENDNGFCYRGWLYVFADWESDSTNDCAFFYDSPSTDPALHLKSDIYFLTHIIHFAFSHWFIIIQKDEEATRGVRRTNIIYPNHPLEDNTYLPCIYLIFVIFKCQNNDTSFLS